MCGPTLFKENSMTDQTTHDTALPWRTDATAPDPDHDGVLKRLQALDCGFGPETSKPERAMLLIAACIMEGVTCGPHIRAILTNFDLDRQHLQLIMNKGAGNDPARYLWRKDKATGAYSLHDPEAEKEPVVVASAAHIKVPKSTAAKSSPTP
jgi:hypothetical protein